MALPWIQKYRLQPTFFFNLFAVTAGNIKSTPLISRELSVTFPRLLRTEFANRPQTHKMRRICRTNRDTLQYTVRWRRYGDNVLHKCARARVHVRTHSRRSASRDARIRHTTRTYATCCIARRDVAHALRERAYNRTNAQSRCFHHFP